jgi:hypothetical protein
MKRYVTVKHIRQLIREQLISEQEPAPPPGEAPPPAPPAAPAETQPSRAPTGLPTDEPKFDNDSIDLQIDSFLTKYDEEAVTGDNEFDVVSFADNVANLVEKSETLLDLKNCIVRRALNRVAKSYDDKTSERVEKILAGSFDLAPEANVDKYNDDSYPAPAADRAGPSPGGSVGG